MCTCITKVLATIVIGCLVLSVTSFEAVAEDRHQGYYYPEPTTEEIYTARVKILPNTSRETRLEFVTSIVNHMASNPYPPQGAIFAKGERGEKLILVSLVDGRMDTLYRMRGILANLTAATRNISEFQQMDPAKRYWLTFLDYCKMMGFEKITVTDGRNLAHQIIIK